jgi:hypothetical protein
MKKLSLLAVLFFIPCAILADTIYVSAPTGDEAIDWISIHDAVNTAAPGDTVQFQDGTYVLGAESEFIVVSTPDLHLKGHRNGTTLIGGDIYVVPESEPCFPALYGNCSLFQSPPRGIYLTSEEQRISHIVFKGFRTAVMIGHGEHAFMGGNIIDECTFSQVAYGIVAHTESTEFSFIRGNSFINSTFPYTLSGGRFHVSQNYLASPEPEKIPLSYTHHAGTLSAGAPFFEEGQASVSENNIFEFNLVDGGISDGFQLIADQAGLVRNNIFRSNEFRNMEFFGTAAIAFSQGGDIVDNVFAKNKLNGSFIWGFILANWSNNYDAAIDGNLIVSNDLQSIANFPNWAYKSGILVERASHTTVMDNVINGVEGDPLWFGAYFGGGHSNQYLLNSTDAYYGAMFEFDLNGVFVSDDPTELAFDQYFIPIEAPDPYQDFSQLRDCTKILTSKNIRLNVSKLLNDFEICVGSALSKLE